MCFPFSGLETFFVRDFAVSVITHSQTFPFPLSAFFFSETAIAAIFRVPFSSCCGYAFYSRIVLSTEIFRPPFRECETPPPPRSCQLTASPFGEQNPFPFLVSTPLCCFEMPPGGGPPSGFLSRAWRAVRKFSCFFFFSFFQSDRNRRLPPKSLPPRTPAILNGFCFW